MTLSRSFALAVILSALISVPAMAGPDDFHAGPIFPEFGKIATIDSDMKLPKRLRLKVSFDAAKPGKVGATNKSFESIARFINMHAEAGVPLKRMDVALVVHGGAAHDLAGNAHYRAKYDGASNANAALIKALTEKGVKIYLCGQSAAYHDIEKSSLLPGVDMALSAMTAHAILQQDGYTLNPF